jgi:hypothetical protein
MEVNMQRRDREGEEEKRKGELKKWVWFTEWASP